MKRWLQAPVAVLALVAAGLGVAERFESGSVHALAYVTGDATSTPAVWLANADGSHARRLGPGTQPLVSPSGAFVAASGPTGLILYRASGGSRRYFLAADATAIAAAFSPDSRYLAVVLSSRDPASTAYSGLAVIDTTTLAARIIVHGQIYGASFPPDGSDRIAYGSAASQALAAPVDIHLVGANGSRPVQITHDGRSLNPVSGRSGIAFDHERLRGDAEPAYQVWLMASDGSGGRPVTALQIPPLCEGLVPIGFSNDGRRLLAEYQGEDISRAWLLSLPGGDATPLGTDLTGSGFSDDGLRALVDVGGFLAPPGRGRAERLFQKLRADRWLPVAPGSGAGRRRAAARVGRRTRRIGGPAVVCPGPGPGIPGGSPRAWRGRG